MAHLKSAVTKVALHAAGEPFAVIREAPGPIVAVALHAGHRLRAGLANHLAITDEARLREEDPHTAEMAPRDVTLVEVLRSRFEVDCNRARFRAVYRGPKDAWGLAVFQHELPDAEDRISRAVYDTFYAGLFDVLARKIERHGRIIVLDLHSYNHRRDGASAPAASAEKNPEVNLGTARLDRVLWSPVVEEFLDGMDEAGFEVGENVKFGGGHLSKWVSESFPDSACTLAIEFKKTYMDEWSGVADELAISRIREALTLLMPRLERALSKV